MGKPKYMEELLKIIFLWLGIAFMGMGLLCFLGVLKPSTNSAVREQAALGIVYALLGAAFLLVQTILRAAASRKEKLRQKLLASGMELSGMVEKVYLQWYTQYGRRSPYRIFYTYTFCGKTYHHKSPLLWDKPDVAEHDPVVVYADDSGKSTIQV